jgi:cytochrome P450
MTLGVRMTDSSQSEMMASIAQNYRLMELAFGDPVLAAARATAEPMQMYTDLTTQCPVRRLADDAFSLLTMEDVLYVNKHHGVEQGSKYLGSDKPAIPLGLDGEEHRKYRRLLDPVFTAKQIAPLADNVVELANELIDTFIDTGGTDVYAAFCEPLPSTIFLSIMGLPMADLEQFIHFKNLTLGNEVVEGLSPDERMARRGEAVLWIHQYFDHDLAVRAGEPSARDDMIGQLMTAEVEGERLTRDDILSILGLLMIAGLDTVAASLACFLSYFARHPEHRREVVAEPSRMRSAVEELMRFESPVTEGFRIAMEDLTLPSGAAIPAGAWMHISWSAANLDPAAFERPLEVDFDRAPNPHIGFASGYHRCLGSHLARMEMDTALRVFHERIPNYAVAPGETLTYSGNPRAPHHLRLTW